MTREDIIHMAREAGGGLSCIAEPLEHPWKFSESELMRFAALIASRGAAKASAAERKAMMQLFTDPENQPTQHGTVTVEYMEREIAAAVEREREACAAICDRFQARDVGMQPAECAGAIRARGQQ